MSELWGSTSPRNEMEEFNRQLHFTERATLAIRREVHLLRQNLKTHPDNALQQKLEYLEGVISSSIRMKTATELKHLGIKEEYADLMVFDIEDQADQAARLEKLRKVYSTMTQLLHVTEHNIWKILGTPTNWFGTQIAAFESWLKMQPVKAGLVVVSSAAFFAGVLALVADAGCKCGTWTVLQHVLIGASVGAGGSLLFLLIFAGYECIYRGAPIKSDSQRLKDMFERLNTIPDDKYIAHLEDLIVDCLCVGGKIPGHEDRFCVACYSEGEAVVEPVRANGCKGHHYMCKPCWKRYIKCPGGREGKCAVCRV